MESRRSGTVHRPRWWLRRRRWLAAIGATLLVLLICAGSVHARIALKSAGFLVEVFPDSPSYPLRWFSDPPARLLTLFPHEEGYHGAFLYQPPDGRECHAGLVLYIGLGPEYRDPHLHRFASALARNGIAVLIPVSETMADYQIDPDEHLAAVSAFRYLQGLDSVDPERVGMFGISIGGSIVANAAQEPEIRDDVRILHSLGGYYDAFDLLSALALETQMVNGAREAWQPSEVTLTTIRDSILSVLPADDRTLLRPLFDGDESNIPDGLSPEGLALAELLVNKDPDRVPELIDDLPESLRRYMRRISPSYGIEQLRAETLLLHDVHDHVLPYSESIRFYDAAENAKSRHLTIIEQFHHVRPDVDGDRRGMVSDGINLYRHIYRLHRSLDGRGWVVGWPDLVPWFDGDDSCRG